MKLLSGVALLCLSLISVVLWCAWLSDPLHGDSDAVYRVVFVPVASPALIAVFWATSLLDGVRRAPRVPAIAPVALLDASGAAIAETASPRSHIRIWTLAVREMRGVPIIAAILLASINSAGAQYGPDFPTEAQRGPAFPKYVSPSATNPTNWVAAPPIPEPAQRSKWGAHWRLRPHAHGRRLHLHNR